MTARAPRRLRRGLAALLFGLCLGASAAHAQNATWRSTPASSDWNTAANWFFVVPRGTARFGASSTTALTFSANASIGTLRFNAGAPAYSFDLSGHTLTIDGTPRGIVNNSSNAPIFTGTGGLIKLGTGTLTLTGANTYTGGTTVSAGTLTLGTGGSLASTGRLTVSGGTFNLNGRSQTVGSLSGTGGAVTLGSGTLTTGADNTSTTFSGVISGTGGLTKTGAGTLMLTAANIYTGATTVSAGRLSVNGSITSPVTIGAAGTLGGTGTIFGGVTTTGTLRPGNSIGTLHVNGNLTFSPGSKYQVEVNPTGQSGFTQVTGTATLGGAAVSVLPATGTYAKQTTYTILTATGGVSGTFAAVTTSSAFLTPTLSYDPNDVFLTLAQTVRFSSVVTTGNAGRVASALDSVAANATGDLATLITALQSLPAGPAEDAFKRLSGELHPSSLGASGFTTNALLGVLRDRLATLREGGAGFGGSSSGSRWPQNALAAAAPSVLGLVNSANDAEALTLPGTLDTSGRAGWWLNGYGGTGGVNSDGGAAGIDYDFGGVAGGADIALTRDLHQGFSLGYTRTGVRVQGRQDTTDIDMYSLAGYGSWSPRPVYLDALLGYAYDSYQTSRHVEAGTFVRTAKSNHGGHTLASGAEVGYRGETGMLRWTPFVGLTYVRQWENAFTEHGAGAANLDVQSSTLDSLGVSVGARLGWRLRAAQDVWVTPEIGVRYTRELLERSAVVPAVLVGAPSASFRVEGVKVPRDDVAPSVGVRVSVTDRVDAALTYTADVRADRVSNLGSAVLRVRW